VDRDRVTAQSVGMRLGLRLRVTGRILVLAVVLLLMTARPAYAATPDLQTVLSNLRLWVAGVLATLATVFLSIGGLMYLTAAGNPRRVEQAKEAIRSAMIGYVFAGLAPLIITIIKQITGL
jgi:type IV secretory pathway VirB2 component (pilin)